jgi:hypothetical protein
MCIAFVRLGQDLDFVSKVIARYMQLGRLVGLLVLLGAGRRMLSREGEHVI